MTEKTELWKDIEGYEGRYMVSNMGRVKSLAHILTTKDGEKRSRKERIFGNGSGKNYVWIRLKHQDKPMKRTSVHREVAIAFIPMEEGKIQVNHINGIRNDNRAENLEWVTVSENARHAMKIGLRGRLKSQDVLDIRDLFELGISKPDLMERFGICRHQVNNIITRRRWGYIDG